MKKNDNIHLRVSEEKKETEIILDDVGQNLSYTIPDFSKQDINKNKDSFEMDSLNMDNISDDEKLAYAINSTGGKEISDKWKKLIHLYVTDQIDYETVLFLIKNNF